MSRRPMVIIVGGGFAGLAQWFAMLSVALYLPGELYSLLRHPRWLKWGVLITNAVVFPFMLALRVKAARRTINIFKLLRQDPTSDSTNPRRSIKLGDPAESLY